MGVICLSSVLGKTILSVFLRKYFRSTLVLQGLDSSSHSLFSYLSSKLIGWRQMNEGKRSSASLLYSVSSELFLSAVVTPREH